MRKPSLEQMLLKAVRSAVPTLQQAALARYGTDENVRRAITNARRRVRAHQARVPHSRYECVGGPFNGQLLDLTSASTAPFTVGGVTGRYRHYRELPEPLAAHARHVATVWAEKAHPHNAYYHLDQAPFVFWVQT